MLEAIEASEGEAGMLQLGTYQRQLHRCEDLVAELGQRDAVSLTDLTRIVPGLAELESLSSETRHLIEHFRQLGHRPAGSNGEAGPDLLRDVESLVRDLAQRLGKSVRFFSHAKSEDIPEQYLDLTRDLLIQGSRNALARSRQSAAAPAAF